MTTPDELIAQAADEYLAAKRKDTSETIDVARVAFAAGAKWGGTQIQHCLYLCRQENLLGKRTFEIIAGAIEKTLGIKMGDNSEWDF